MESGREERGEREGGKEVEREKAEGEGGGRGGREGIREREEGRKSWRVWEGKTEGSWKAGTVVRKEGSQKGGRVEGNKVCVWLHTHTHMEYATDSESR